MVPSPVKDVLATLLLSLACGSVEAQLGPAKNQLFEQATAFSSVSTHESDDRLGAALAAGDFNGDGWDDLAVGSPGEDIGATVDAGAVFLIFGGADGLQQRIGSLSGIAAEAFNQDDLEAAGDTLGGGAEIADHFGEVLAAGDFDADGFDDLVVGVPSENLESPAIVDAGLVVVVHGSAQGLRGTSGQMRFQVWDADRVPVWATSNARFGTSLAVGNFDGDDADDLAVGVPQETEIQAGSVWTYYGAPETGLGELGRTVLLESADAGFGGPESGDWFGHSVAAADLDLDGFDDLAITAPGEEIIPGEQYGVLFAARGAASGLGQPSSGWEVTNLPGREKTTLATGRVFDADPYPDLVLGVPGAGFLLAASGSASGLTPPSEETVDASERGFALACADLDGRGLDSVVSGNPRTDIQRIFVIAFGNGKPTEVEWRQGAGGLVDALEAGDRFGEVVAVGEFGLGEGIDLAVGVPLEDSFSQTDSGAFHVIYNILLFDDGFESTNLAEWSDFEP